MKMAEGGADYDALMKRMDKLQTAIDAIEGWELDRQLERAMQALRCPPGMCLTLFTFPRLLLHPLHPIIFPLHLPCSSSSLSSASVPCFAESVHKVN